MKRFLFALFSILGLSSARAADIITTHHFSADLAHEGNGVITASGLGWPGIVALNAAVVVGISLCTLYWWRRPLRYASVAGSDDPWSLASFNYFGRVFSPASFLWRLSVSWPKNWRMFAQFVGVVAPSLLMAASTMAVVFAGLRCTSGTGPLTGRFTGSFSLASLTRCWCLSTAASSPDSTAASGVASTPPRPRPNHALQRTEAGGTSVMLSSSDLASLCR